MLKKIAISISVLFIFLSTPLYAIEEGVYQLGNTFFSVLKNNSYVMIHEISFSEQSWQLYRGHENSDGSVDLVARDFDDIKDVTVSATSSGLLIKENFCIPQGDYDDCTFMEEPYEAKLLFPDTGDFSGLYEGIIFQNFIIHQVGQKLLVISLETQPDGFQGIEVYKFNINAESSVTLETSIYTNIGGEDGFTADIRAEFSGDDREDGDFLLDNCVTADIGVTCDQLDIIFDVHRVF